MKRASSTGPLARRRVDRLRALRADPNALHDFAMEVLVDEANPEIVKLAIESIGEGVRSADHPVLRELYSYFDTDGSKKDPGGDVRVEVLKVLWELRSTSDIELAMRARATSERTFQGNGEMIRAAGLALLAVLDPPRAATEAVLVLGRDERDLLTASSAMTGEPALTAVNVLAATGESNALLLYVLSGAAPTPEVTAAALKGLSGIDLDVLRPILAGLAGSEDDGVLMAVGDAIIELPPDPRLKSIVLRLLNSPTRGELYEFIASSIVASRREELIAALLESLPGEMSRKRLTAAKNALELAPRTPAVEVALGDLGRRLASG